MSLTFSGSTDKVSVGTGTNITDLAAGTYCAWVNPSSVASGTHRIYQKGVGAAADFFVLGDVNAGDFRITTPRATTGLRAQSNGSVVSAGVWQYLAGSWDTTLTNADQHLYYGSLTTDAAEIGSYSTQVVGSGSITSNSGAAGVIGNKANDNGALSGDIHAFAIFNRQLTLGEIIEWQWHPRVFSGCVGFWLLGWNGTGTQPDWSGSGNAGTVTAAAVATPAPLGRLFRPVEVAPYVVAAATGTGGPLIGGRIMRGMLVGGRLVA